MPKLFHLQKFEVAGFAQFTHSQSEVIFLLMEAKVVNLDNLFSSIIFIGLLFLSELNFWGIKSDLEHLYS
jgi:hypothetical protein